MWHSVWWGTDFWECAPIVALNTHLVGVFIVLVGLFIVLVGLFMRERRDQAGAVGLFIVLVGLFIVLEWAPIVALNTHFATARRPVSGTGGKNNCTSPKKNIIHKSKKNITLDKNTSRLPGSCCRVLEKIFYKSKKKNITLDKDTFDQLQAVCVGFWRKFSKWHKFCCAL